MNLNDAIKNVFGWTIEEKRAYEIKAKMNEIFARLNPQDDMPWDEDWED